MPKVVAIGEMGGGAPPGLDRLGDRVVVRHVKDIEELERELPGAAVVLVWDFRSTLLRELWDRADSVRWVHVAGAGVDAVLSARFAESDVMLTNAHGVFDRSIAETVVGMMLVFAKDMLRTFELQRRRTWLHRETEMLAGRTALVVGAGGIGREIARVLGPLGVDVVGVASSERPDPDFGRLYAIESLDRLLPRADFVVLVVPLTDRTRGLVGEARLRLMKPTARLINVGRGGLVDERALVAALEAGEIAGAALDVFEDEPLPESHPLWSMPQVLVSPHMSADFKGWLEALADQFFENLELWLDGRPLKNLVDKRLGYVPGAPEKDPA